MKAVLVLALLAVLCPLVFFGDPANTIRVDVDVYDIDIDQPVSNATVELVMLADCGFGREIFRSTAVTNDKGRFEIALPVGDHLLSVTAPARETVSDCVNIASPSTFEQCKSEAKQGLIVRTAGQRLLPADIVNQHPCAQMEHTVCDELALPSEIQSRHVIFVDEEGRPFANLKLEFRPIGRLKNDLLGTVVTDEKGAADLTEIFAHPKAAGTVVNVGRFQLQLSGRGPADRPQRVTIVKWKCGGHELWQRQRRFPGSATL